MLLRTFGAYIDDSPELFLPLVPYFTQQLVLSGAVLWEQDDLADGLYLIESGSLRATYSYLDHRELVQETMVAGTVAGDLSTLSDTKRNATVIAERDCVLWKLDTDALSRLEEDLPRVARRFTRLVLKGERLRVVQMDLANKE